LIKKHTKGHVSKAPKLLGANKTHSHTQKHKKRETRQRT